MPAQFPHMKDNGLLDELDVSVICRPSRGMGKIPNAPSVVSSNFNVKDVFDACEESLHISKESQCQDSKY